MKKLLTTLTCLFALLVVFFNFNSITNFLIDKINNSHKLIIKDANSYEKDYAFNFVQESENFIPYSKQDLLNIIYTTINKGWNEFTFYCPSEYKDCVKDITSMSDDDILLANLNSFVHPFNSFTNIKTTISDSGEIILHIYYLYTEEQINKIESKVKELISTTIKNDDSDYDKIKKLHDKIINTTKYDVERNKNNDSKYLSYIAYGPLFDGYATCNGYTDLMAIILSELNFKNFKVTTSSKALDDGQTGHIWNAVYINNKWLHLDLTWDDPVSKDGKDYLYHTYFLINTKDLNKADTGQVKLNDHNFDQAVYSELKNID